MKKITIVIITIAILSLIFVGISYAQDNIPEPIADTSEFVPPESVGNELFDWLLVKLQIPQFATATLVFVALFKNVPYLNKFEARWINFAVTLILYSAYVVATQSGMITELTNAVDLLANLGEVIVGYLGVSIGATALYRGSKWGNVPLLSIAQSKEPDG